MKYTICITILNDKKGAKKLLENITFHAKKFYELVVIDGGSEDGTVELIKKFQEKHKNIKLIVKKCSRAEGRNIAVENSNADNIVMTDAGCIPHKLWLKRITEPFKDKNVDIVAGFYEMKAETPLQQAMAVYLGTMPDEFDDNFLPSARSIAFRKSIWKKIGGFPEDLDDTAEDTVFILNAVKEGAVIKRVKDAIVYWEVPNTISEFYKKIKNYARGDAKSRVFWHPVKKWKTHNIKALSVFARYLLFILALLLSQTLFILLIVLYLVWGMSKLINKTGKIEIGLWAIILQPLSDIAVLVGFIQGILL